MTMKILCLMNATTTHNKYVKRVAFHIAKIFSGNIFSRREK